MNYSVAPPLPLVGIPACARQLGHHPFHIAGDKYIRAVSDGAGALPLVIPALGDTLDLAGLVERLDGLLVTGSPSNVEPARYGGPSSVPGTLHDPERDATTLPLVRAALAAGVPVLAICRGIVEAHGGRIAAQPGLNGAGTCIVIRLPLTDADQPETPPAETVE